MIASGEINLASIKSEMQATFDRYEAALMSNDLDALDNCFWQSPLVVRFGDMENLYGIDAIQAFRKARLGGALKRTLINTIITTYGKDAATTTTEFVRADRKIGRQSQTWVRFAEGWRIVSAHISILDTRLLQSNQQAGFSPPSMRQQARS